MCSEETCLATYHCVHEAKVEFSISINVRIVQIWLHAVRTGQLEYVLLSNVDPHAACQAFLTQHTVAEWWSLHLKHTHIAYM